MPEALAAVGDSCKSVVACRARKDQKAQMLNLIKKSVPYCCTLAIGDGANDVAMIKEGHIGVGIIGKEGRECVNAADFAIGKFRFLRSLLLVHGRYNYRRFSIFLYYTFYKNIMITMTLFFYSMLAAASAQLLLPSIFNDLLNPVMLTSLPIIIFPMFDTDVPKEESAKSPKLYTAGITRFHFTHRKMVYWVVEGIYAAVIVTFVPMLTELGYVWATSISLSEASMGALWTLCIAINVRLTLENNSWTILEVLGPILMLCMLVIWSVIFNYVPSTEFDGAFSWPLLVNAMGPTLGRGVFWLQLMLIVIFILTPRMLHLAYIHVYYETKRAHMETVAAVELKATQGRRRASIALVEHSIPGVPAVDVSIRETSESGLDDASDSASGLSRRSKHWAEAGRMSRMVSHLSQRSSGPGNSVSSRTSRRGEALARIPSDALAGLGSPRDPTTLKSRAQSAFDVDPVAQNTILLKSSRWMKVAAKMKEGGLEADYEHEHVHGGLEHEHGPVHQTKRGASVSDLSAAAAAVAAGDIELHDAN